MFAKKKVKFKIHFLGVMVLALGLILTACSTGPATQQPVEPSPNVPVEGVIPTEVIEAVVARIGIETEGFEIRDSKAVDWPNACLGFPGADEMCAEVITPGYTGTILIQGASYEFRTDANGSQVRLIPAALDAARKFLADSLQVELDAVRWVEIMAQDWPDACLGMQRADISCAQVITPGFRVVLDVAGNTYVLRTNESGSQVIMEIGMN